MRSKRNTVITAIILLFLVSSYNHCGRVQFKALEGPNPFSIYGDTGTDDDGEPVLEVPPDIVMKACETGQRIPFQVVVQISESMDKTCDWGLPGNRVYAEIKDRERHFSAKKTTSSKFELPSSSVICSASLSSNEQDFEYDDLFAITFNGQVIAGSAEILNKLTNGNPSDLTKFDWERLFDSSFDDYKPSDLNRNDWDDVVLCPMSNSSETCIFPGSEERGQLSIALDNSTIQMLSSKNVLRSRHDISLTVIGDNDDATSNGTPIDCRHKGVDIVISGEYILP